jgi:beta-lactamase regulating signal transducer with metallopeptidase domain
MTVTSFLITWIDPFFIFMKNQFLTSAVFLLVAFLIWALLRRRMSSHLFYALFLLVILQAAIPFSFEFSRSSIGPYSGNDEIRLVEFFFSAKENVLGLFSFIEDMGQDTLMGFLYTDDNPLGTTSLWFLLIAMMIRVIWLFFLFKLLYLLSWNFFLSSRWVSRLAPVDTDSVGIDYDELIKFADIRRNVPLLFSDTIHSPMAIGLLKPCIVVPTDFFDLVTPAQAKWMLLHELSHISRKDLWISLLQRVVQQLHLFNPFIWIANITVDRFRELSCDDTALKYCSISENECCEGLLTLLSHKHNKSEQWIISASLFSPLSEMTTRFQHILNKNKLLYSRLSLGSLILLAMIFILISPSILIQEKDVPIETFVQSIVPTVDTSTQKGILSGRILNADTQKAISADVCLIQKDDFRGALSYRTKSDKDGQFTLSEISPGDYTLQVIAPEYQIFDTYTVDRILSQRNYVSIYPSITLKDYVVKLQPAVRAQLKVLSPTGTPVHDADVTCFISSNRFPFTGKTNKEGILSLPHLPPIGNIALVVRKNGYGEWIGETKIAKEYTIRLHHPKTIYGKISNRESKRVISDISVFYSPGLLFDKVTADPFFVQRKIKTDHEGNYQIQNLGPYPYTLSLNGDQVAHGKNRPQQLFDTPPKEVFLQDANSVESRVDIVSQPLDLRGKIVLKIKTPDNTPVTGIQATVSIMQFADHLYNEKRYYPAAATNRVVFSNERGEIVIQDIVPYESFAVKLSSDHYSVASEMVDETGLLTSKTLSRTSEGSYVIVMNLTCQITGTVIDYTSKHPINNATVEIIGLDNDCVVSLHTLETGTFSTHGLLPQKYRIKIRAEAYTETQYDSVPAFAGKRTNLIPIELKPIN